MLTFQESEIGNSLTTFYLAFNHADYSKLIEKLKELSIGETCTQVYNYKGKVITTFTCASNSIENMKKIWHLLWAYKGLEVKDGKSPSEMLESLIS